MAEAILQNYLVSSSQGTLDYLGIYQSDSDGANQTLPRPYSNLLCIFPLFGTGGITFVAVTDVQIIPISTAKQYSVCAMITSYGVLKDATFYLTISHPSDDIITVQRGRIEEFNSSNSESRQYKILVFGIS